MAGLLDNILRPVVGNVIDLLGTTATLITPGAEVLDPITGDFTQGEGTSVTITCSPPLNYGIGQIDGTRILQGDMRLIVPTSNYPSEPTTKQKVTIRDREYQIISVKPYSSGNSEAAWELQLRA